MNQKALFRQDNLSDFIQQPAISCPAADEKSASVTLESPDPVHQFLSAIATFKTTPQSGLGLPAQMLSRLEEQWQELVATLDSSWEWNCVVAVWQKLIELDFRFFRGRFREIVAETIPNARYIPGSALSFILQYCRHQPAEVKQLYHDAWKYQLHHQRWMHSRQAEVVAWYLERWHLSTPGFLPPENQP